MAIRIIVKYVDVGATYYFNKTCPPMLTTKSTCWTTTASPVLRIGTDDIVALGLVYQFLKSTFIVIKGPAGLF